MVASSPSSAPDGGHHHSFVGLGVAGGSSVSSSASSQAGTGSALFHRGGSGSHYPFSASGGIHKRMRVRMPAKVIVQTKAALTKHAKRIAKKADEHEHLINKITYCVSVLGFGIFCYILGARPQDIPYLYCAFFLLAAPLRWIYYKTKKWHYFLLDFCYYANAILICHLLFFPAREKLFLLCFAFHEGPVAWALIVWRCSLVFSSLDKIVSVLIHLLPGIVIFIIRWWDPITFAHHNVEETGPWPAWPLVNDGNALWLWMFLVPLAVYCLWQLLYFLVVDVLKKQRFVNDPEVLTSFRELSRKASRANNFWWKISGVLGDSNRSFTFMLLQGVFTALTIALTVPMFTSYRFHAGFQLFKFAASIWNGGNFFFDVMPRQLTAKAAKKAAASGKVPKSPQNGPEASAVQGGHQHPAAEGNGEEGREVRRAGAGTLQMPVKEVMDEAEALKEKEKHELSCPRCHSRWTREEEGQTVTDASVQGNEPSGKPATPAEEEEEEIWEEVEQTGEDLLLASALPSKAMPGGCTADVPNLVAVGEGKGRSSSKEVGGEGERGRGAESQELPPPSSQQQSGSGYRGGGLVALLRRKGCAKALNVHGSDRVAYVS